MLAKFRCAQRRLACCSERHFIGSLVSHFSDFQRRWPRHHRHNGLYQSLVIQAVWFDHALDPFQRHRPNALAARKCDQTHAFVDLGLPRLPMVCYRVDKKRL